MHNCISSYYYLYIIKIVFILRLCSPSRSQNENQRKRKERHVLRPCQRTMKAVKQEGDGGTNCNWLAWNDP